MALKRRRQEEQGADGQPRKPEYTDEVFAKKYPTIAEFMQEEWWDAKTPRRTGTVLLFCEDGLFKACLNDRDGEFVAFVTKTTFVGLLEALEKGLATDSLDWRLTAKNRQRKFR